MTVYSEVLVRRAPEVAKRPLRMVTKDVDTRVRKTSPEERPQALKMLGAAAIAIYMVAGGAAAAEGVGIERVVENYSGNEVVGLIGDALFVAELTLGGSQLQLIAYRRGRIQPDDIEIPIASSMTYTYENFQDNTAA